MANTTGTDFLPAVGDVVEALIPREAAPIAAPQFVTSAPRQKIKVFYLESTRTDRDRRSVMLALTLAGRCEDIRPTAWQSWVLTWSVICFPELVTTLRNDSNSVDYEYTALGDEFVSSCYEAVKAQAVETTASTTPLSLPSALPSVDKVHLTPDHVNAGTYDTLYAYYAMLVFVLGKSINPDNVVAISKNRPEALMRKRSLQAGSYLLIGEGQMSPNNYRFIQSGWIRSTRPRMTIVDHLAKLNAAENTSEMLDPISVNMDMLKNSGQSYLFYIHELLVACPWAISLPSLRSSFYHYSRMVKILQRQPGYLQPYYKLMMQDVTKDIRRRDIEPLIAVATFFAAQTRKTMNQYRIDVAAIPIIRAFRELAAARGIVFSEIQNQLTTEVQAI